MPMETTLRFKSARAPFRILVLIGFALTVLTAIDSTHAGADPRCTDTSAKGVFDCVISQPVVTKSDWVVSTVKFAAGDKIYVNADGCVQTGGSGDTWKRYVNPTGANSASYYHGLIRIPTAKLAGTDIGNSMTRLVRVVGRAITVAGAPGQTSDIPLHIGYNDDNLNDNGYYSHDDGTEDQCKTSGSNDGGPAHLTITICRAVSCTAPVSRFPFDVVSSSLDTNGFLFMPHWSFQGRAGNQKTIPATSMCHEFSKYDVLRTPSPNFPDCTDQAGLDSVDEPIEINEKVCNLPKLVDVVDTGDPFAGHVNWFPVTVEGDAGPITHEAGDDDYDFSLRYADKNNVSLFTNGRSFLHVEFDSDETVDHFNSNEWKLVHDAVDAYDNAKAAFASCASVHCSAEQAVALAETMATAKKNSETYFSGFMIGTGLFGLDGEHGIKSELHPLYAMAQRRDSYEQNPNDEGWLIFVRNIGDEGYCSSHLWSAGFEDYTFRLPWRDGMTSAEVLWDKTQFEATDGASGPEVKIVPPIFVHTIDHGVPLNNLSRRVTSAAPSATSRAPAATSVAPASVARVTDALGLSPGIYVTFHLGNAVSAPFVDGALHLKWSGPGNSGGNTTTVSTSGVQGQVSRVDSEVEVEESDEAEHVFEASLGKAPVSKQLNIRRARANTTAALPKTAVHFGQPVRMAAVARVAGQVVHTSSAPVSGSAGVAIDKNRRDKAQMSALCAATNNAPAGLPAAICSVH